MCAITTGEAPDTNRIIEWKTGDRSDFVRDRHGDAQGVERYCHIFDTLMDKKRSARGDRSTGRREQAAAQASEPASDLLSGNWTWTGLNIRSVSAAD